MNTERLDFVGRKVVAVDVVGGLTYIGEFYEKVARDARGIEGFSLVDFVVTKTDTLIGRDYASKAKVFYETNNETDHNQNYLRKPSPGPYHLNSQNVIGVTPVIDLDKFPEERKAN
jgi:hypothetical protein